MNRRSLCYLLLALSCIGSPAVADVDDPVQIWPSPDRQFVMHHLPSVAIDSSITNLARISGTHLATYVLTSRDIPIWTGVSDIDESSHHFHCLWSADSSAALIMDRPSRGSANITLVRPSSPVRTIVLPVQHQIIDPALTSARKDNAAVLEKQWFGEWRFIKDHFEGMLIVAHQQYHCFRLSLIPTAEKPVLKILDVHAEDHWDDRFGKL